jgi:hypothetical protein
VIITIRMSWALLGFLSLGAVAATDYMETHLSSPFPRAHKEKSFSGHLGATSNQLSNQVGNVPGNKSSFDFEFKFSKNRNTQQTGLIERNFELSGLSNDQNLNQFSLQEAYVGGRLNSKTHLRFGRQILPWSGIDEIWGFGKLNNRKNFTGFSPGQEGLVGLLYERKSSNGMKTKAFISGFYVPEMNPSMDIDKKNRSITSRTPWADAPASSANVDVNGSLVAMDVKYDVKYPGLNDVIWRYTAGLNLGWESKHWQIDNFVMRKPENGLTPQVDVNVDFVSNVVNATINPQFYYHDLYGSTLKYRNKSTEIYLSGIAVRPNEYPDVNPDVKYTEIKNKKRREDYVGGGISRSNDRYTLSFNYVARLSPFDRLTDDLSPDPRWNQALNFFVATNWSNKLALSGDLKYDMLTTDRLMMVRGTYQFTTAFQVNMGVNMIGTPTNGKSYWSPYTNNDAIYGGLRYVY